MAFREISMEEANFPAFTKIEDWALLTAGTREAFNMLTVTGLLCGQFFLRKMAQVYVHPSRHSYRFMNESAYFNVSFFDRPKHPALQICGQKSGRDCDKAKEAGLTPAVYDKTVIFEEAELILICRKVYHTDVLEESFDDPAVFGSYYKEPRGKAFHRIFLGEVEKVLKKY